MTGLSPTHPWAAGFTLAITTATFHAVTVGIPVASSATAIICKDAGSIFATVVAPSTDPRGEQRCSPLYPS